LLYFIVPIVIIFILNLLSGSSGLHFEPEEIMQIGNETKSAPDESAKRACVECAERSPESTILTVKEVAVLFKVTERTIRSMIADGRLPHFRVAGCVRFRSQCIEAYINSTMVPGRR